MGENILDLSTIVDRPTITITSKKHPRGKLYEILGVADLGPFEYAEIVSRSAEADQLRERKRETGRLTVAQQRRMEKALDDIVSVVMPSLEPAVLAELTVAQKENIVIAWSAHVASQAEEAAAGKA